MRRMLTSSTVLTLLLSGGAVTAQEASPDPGASPTPEQLAEAEERISTTSCFGEPATMVAIAGFETIGRPGADVIVGTEGDDIIRGGGGKDRICAGAGADLVEGGDGKDRISGGAGDDQLDGGASNDTISGGKGDDLVRGGVGNDRLSGAGGDDRLEGGQGSDRCDGGGGSDWLPSCNDRSQTRGTRFITSDTKLKGPHRGRIVMQTDNVTLDCAGFDIRGPGGGAGIYLGNEKKGIVVRNCEVSNFGIGIVFDQTFGNRFLNNYVHDNSQLGFEVRSSRNNRLIGNTSDDNGRIGFEVSERDAFGNVLKRNRASGNDEADFVLVNAPRRNTVIRSLSEGGEAGFVLSGNRNEVRGNRATRNGSTGMYSEMSNSTIADNVVSGSLGVGFLIEGFRNEVTGNHSSDNLGIGLADQSMPGANSYEGNICINNAEGLSEPEGLCDDTPPVQTDEPDESPELEDPPAPEE